MPKAANTLPLADTAHRLRVSEGVARRLLLTGQLEGERDGRYWIVSLESIERYEAARSTRLAQPA